ncbi:MAG: hypothetical protein COU28_01890 [Candidatus Magasanikbacteria bacterium CG10_big_fil_rev_8_21_14_0_10_36_16]|uniref:Hydrogenase n=1 Tax=Candidatus Magasanikbacteria bacterium CG10_big_fil_rev_8_21_14_0_10_36_16 TaxID=1974645 RepID=A0A2H0TYT8_9BACT|nr:MAG: hypothetical protein COU28_01890 [Candidatus Magasanikbacteria bacterium CG10_big_fil_rev_8_21_14_0_10_36_16]
MKKNFSAVSFYSLQSLVVVIILLNSFFETKELLMLLVIFIMFIVKVIIAPLFFIRLIKKYALSFSASTYLSTPITLIIITILVFIAHSQRLLPLTSIVANHQILLSLALSSMFLSLFLIVNRKGALSQIIGILSFENSIVVFAVFANLEQSASLQLGIIFDIFIWIMIASIFISMLYKHFGTLNVSSMKKLKD